MIDKKTVLITGASRGIGHACALSLAQQGHRVIAGVRQQADLERLAKEHDNLMPMILDVTDPDQVQAVRGRVVELLEDKGLDGLINNAGTAITGALECLPLEMFRGQIELNVTGQQIVTQAFLPLLRKARGRIVFMSSVSGLVARPFLGPYCASKFALEALADAYRGELAPWGIQVSVIEPGSIRTDIWDTTTRQTEAVTAAMSAEERDLYGDAFVQHQKVLGKISARIAVDPQAVVTKVEHALFASRPKTRYRVGPGALIDYILGGFVPDRLRDFLLRKIGEFLAGK